ncbi:MAG TPA: phosphoribosylamine--glycine ligase, partial [Candidatus Omnitrophota bacterium]|nr:phosphoribosylamine--glycine ligase [Candidatus Omnitrophota bacterium]
VVGSGGREHALVWKIAQSPLVKKIFCAPGNAGIGQIAECVDIKADDIVGLMEFARKEKIGLTVVGPEGALAAGIADEFSKVGLKVFGPRKKAARLEASKVFSKRLMKKYGVPTAAFEVFDNPDKARAYIEKIGAPCVVKADGLAAGKGVVVAKTVDEAQQAVISMMQKKIFGEAGNTVIVEECLVGEEASVLVITDSKTVIPLASAQDHKRIFDNDQGPNTGGMGAYSPAPLVTGECAKEILEKIIFRTVDGLAKEGIVYQGVLYAGVMVTKDGPKTLEFNVRFGDPETQAILPRIESDIVEVMLAAVNGTLNKFERAGGLRWDSGACVSIVCAAKGYPGDYEKGKEITGLSEAAQLENTIVFHAGTKLQGKTIVTSGGRVLGVTGIGASIQEAIDTAYRGVRKIHFEGMQFRSDIGARALKRS